MIEEVFLRMINPKIKTATFRGKRYRIVWKVPAKHKVKGEDILGICDPPSQKDKIICIMESGNDKENFDTHIHEVLHAAFWDIDESVIEQASIDITDFLWRCGYRKTIT
jgi:hypothetical protein